nr:structural maintenance of chromosomes protein 1 [Tanacetum cinerariifolium]GEZ06902.1 structural maintenance of chromosomes protein 1 [Tanacetum cinerariifolium]
VPTATEVVNLKFHLSDTLWNIYHFRHLLQGKELGLEVPPDEPYVEKHCGCWSGYSYYNIEDNAPNSATSASTMLDEANFNGISHGGNSSSDNEVVVRDDEELVMCNGTSTSDPNPFIQQNKETDGDLKMDVEYGDNLLSMLASEAQKNQRRPVLMLGKKQGTSINLAVKPRTWHRHGLLGDAYLSQVVEALRRLFPSVHGRMTELCRPTQKKYNLGVTVAMGKFMDYVVDNE